MTEISCCTSTYLTGKLTHATIDQKVIKLLQSLKAMMMSLNRPAALRITALLIFGCLFIYTANMTGCSHVKSPAATSAGLEKPTAPVGDILLASLPGHYVADVSRITIDTGNANSFAAKLAAIRAATKSIEIMYYIFIDYGFDHDYSSSIFIEELLAAAKRGVNVRIIVDDGTTHKRRVRFQALKAQAIRAGVGDNLNIAYFRPMTLPIGSKLKPLETLALETHDVLKTSNFDLKTLITLINASLDPAAVAELAAKNIDLGQYIRLTWAAYQVQSKLSVVQSNAKSAFFASLTDLFGTTPIGDSGFTGMLAKFLSKAIGEPVSDQEMQEILDILKRMHHKLLVVDERLAIGGGRNMWDISNLEFDHPLRPVERKNDTDVDYIVEDPHMALKTLATFNEYWECTQNSACAAGIPMNVESGYEPKNSDQVDVWTSTIASDAEQFRKQGDERRQTHKAVYDDRLIGQNMPVVYLENRLYKFAGHEEAGKVIPAWARLIDATQKGQEVLIQNAYLVLPSDLIVSIVKALGRGVKFILMTNAAEVCDNSITPMLARLQIEALMAMLQEIGRPDLLDYYENNRFQQLHTKVSVIGDYLMVGSANADSRSAYLNTENAMVFGRGASKVLWEGRGDKFDSLAQAYLAMTKEKLRMYTMNSSQPNPGDRFRKLDYAALKAEVDLASQGANAAIMKILRMQFAISLRLGQKLTARDLPDISRCSDGKEGAQKAGCAMRRWLYEIMFLQF